MGTTIDAVWVTLRNEVARLAVANVKQYANEAKADGLHVLDSLNADLQTWTKQLAEGKLTTEDVEFLIMGKKELIEMNALKQTGLGKIKADEFKNSVLELVIKTVVGMV